MSLCVVVQTSDEIYIGTDTALSIPINGKIYRLALPNEPLASKKISTVGKKMIYCSGFSEYIPSTLDFITANPAATNEEVTVWLNGTVKNPYNESDVDIELGHSLVICEIINGKSNVRCFASKEAYACQEYAPREGVINLITTGVNDNSAYNDAVCLLQGSAEIDLPKVYQQIYDNASCNAVGGHLLLYRASDSVLLYYTKIKELNIEYHYIDDVNQIKKSVSANMGVLTAGSITANCSIDVATNIRLGNQLTLTGTSGGIVMPGGASISFSGGVLTLSAMGGTFVQGSASFSNVPLVSGQGSLATQSWVLNNLPPGPQGSTGATGSPGPQGPPGPAGPPSDMRDKINIRNLEFNSLDFLNKLRPVQFNYKFRDEVKNNSLARYYIESEGERPQTGFIAQEVKDVANDLDYDFAGVKHDNKNDMYSLRLEMFVPILVGAVQELVQKNKALEKKIDKITKQKT